VEELTGGATKETQIETKLAGINDDWADLVGRCRLPVSKTVLNVHMLSALEAII
jgi:hypothetical protein